MLTSGVGGLDEERVAMDGTGPPDEIGCERMQVPGEQGGLGPVHFVHRGPGDVAGGMGRDLEVSDVDIVPEIDCPVPAARGPQVSVIERGVEAFRVGDLQGVRQEEVRDIGGRRSQDNVHVLPAGDPRDHPGMVEVGMADEHPVHGRGGHRGFRRGARGEPPNKKEGGGAPLSEPPPAARPPGAPAEKKKHPFPPPPSAALPTPAARPPSMTSPLTVGGGGRRPGTKPPVAFPGWRPRAATNLLNRSRRFPRKRSQVPRPTFAHPAFGMIHAYPPGARLPKNISVASLKSPSAVALIAGAETGHSSPTDFATVDRGPSDPTTTFPWNVPRFVSTSSPRTRTTVVSVISSAPSCTACAAIPWSILSRRTVKPWNGMSYRRPFGDQIRMTGVSISRTR